MNCPESRDLLHAYADDELDVANRLELERHFNICAACAAQRQSIQSLKTLLQQPALRYTAPDSLREELYQKLGTSQRDAHFGLFQSLWFWKALASVATVAALVSLLARPGIFAPDPWLDEVVSSHVRSLMVDHLTDVASSDQHTVKPWFNGKLDFAPSVKDFAAQGYPLMGGRLDYSDGRPVAALVYRRSQHVINVFIWPTTETTEGRPLVEHRRGYSVVKCVVGGLRYCFVSDLNQEDLADFANVMRQ